MKKMVIFAVFLILLSSLAFAAAERGDDSGREQTQTEEVSVAESESVLVASNAEVTTQTREQNQGEETQIENTVRVRAQEATPASEEAQQTQARVREQARAQTQAEGLQEINQNRQGILDVADSADFENSNGMIVFQRENNNRIQLRSQSGSAYSDIALSEDNSGNKTKVFAKLSNGRNAEIKIMPESASETALERLRLNSCTEEENCTIEIKEVGQGETIRAAYEVQAQKEAKVLGIFRTRMKVQAQVDAETGEVINAKKPWWAFLAYE